MIPVFTESLTLHRDYFGSGSVSILMYNVQCAGSESLLLLCRSSSSSYQPSNYGTAGVSCLASESFITKYFASGVNLAAQ